MPIYDRICNTCGAVSLDLMERIEGVRDPACPCGGAMKRGFTQRSTTIIGDEIVGGVDIKHGLCNDDGTPRRYYSKSELKAEAKARGLENMVRHVPLPGTDKSPHTVRWVAARTITEDERVAHIRETYRQEGIDLDHLPSAPLPEGVQSIVEDRLHRVIAQAVTERFGV